MNTLPSIEQRPLTPWRTKSGVIVGGAYRKPLPPLSADAEAIQAALLGRVDTDVAIIQALVNGRWCDPADVFSQALIERWAEQIAEREDEQAREASEPPERDRYDDARDFAEAAL